MLHQKSNPPTNSGLQLAKPVLSFPNGPWQILLQHAYTLLDAIASDGITVPRWSFGGGTVLMFHYAHRKSKDIDIFVPDPQFLGYVNPRTGGRKMLRPSIKMVLNT